MIKEIFGNIIPQPDQDALRNIHQITTCDDLVKKKALMEQGKLEGVCADVQKDLVVLCAYMMESLESPSSFTWEGFANFCDYADASGDFVVDEDDEVAPKTSTPQKDFDEDAEGLNLTAEERKQLKDLVENDPLQMLVRGFSPKHMQFQFDNGNNKSKNAEKEFSEKLFVDFNGKRYHVGKCYRFKQSNGTVVTVGIRRFTKVRI